MTPEQEALAIWSDAFQMWNTADQVRTLEARFELRAVRDGWDTSDRLFIALRRVLSQRICELELGIDLIQGGN